MRKAPDQSLSVRLEKELQGELYVSRRVHRGIHQTECRRRWRIVNVRVGELNVIEGVDKIGTELQRRPLGEVEVFQQAQVGVGIARPPIGTLGRAVAEGARRRQAVRIGIEPLITLEDALRNDGLAGSIVLRRRRITVDPSSP